MAAADAAGWQGKLERSREAGRERACEWERGAG